MPDHHTNSGLHLQDLHQISENYYMIIKILKVINKIILTIMLQEKLQETFQFKSEIYNRLILFLKS